MEKSVYKHDNIMICESLKRARIKAKISQIELSKKLKTEQSFVSRYESGQRRIDIVEFFQICEAIGIDPFGILKSWIVSKRIRSSTYFC